MWLWLMVDRSIYCCWHRGLRELLPLQLHRQSACALLCRRQFWSLVFVLYL